MIPVFCKLKHDPEAGVYGDCVRAAIASLLDIENADDVPHFYFDNDPVAGIKRLHQFCHKQGYAPFFTHYDGLVPLADVLAMIGEINPDGHYLLFGSTPEGDHVVVCQGSTVVHNPSWCGNHLTGCGSSGAWSIMVLARL